MAVGEDGVLVKFADLTMNASTMNQENPGSFSISFSVDPPNYYAKRIGDHILLKGRVPPVYITWTIKAIVPMQLALKCQKLIDNQFKLTTDNIIKEKGLIIEIEIVGLIQTKSAAWISSYTMGDLLYKPGLEDIGKDALMQEITIVAKERKLRKILDWSKKN
jgi:hypothetical protein